MNIDNTVAQTAYQATPPPVRNPNVSITPGEDNVSDGNKSQNSVVVSLSVAGQDLSKEVTRQEFVDGQQSNAEDQAKEAYVKSSVEAQQNDLQDIADTRDLIEKTDASQEQVVNYAYQQSQAELAEDFLSQSASDDDDDNTSSSSEQINDDFLELSQQAAESNKRRTFFTADTAQEYLNQPRPTFEAVT